MFSMTELKQKLVRQESGKYPNMCKLNNTFLNNPWDKDEITRENRKQFEVSENETHISKFL